MKRSKDLYYSPGTKGSTQVGVILVGSSRVTLKEKEKHFSSHQRLYIGKMVRRNCARQDVRSQVRIFTPCMCILHEMVKLQLFYLWSCNRCSIYKIRKIFYNKISKKNLSRKIKTFYLKNRTCSKNKTEPDVLKNVLE